MTIADELRAAADKVAPAPATRPSLADQYPNLDACYAQIFRDAAETCDAVTRHGIAIDERADWLVPTLAAARKINEAQP